MCKKKMSRMRKNRYKLTTYFNVKIGQAFRASDGVFYVKKKMAAENWADPNKLVMFATLEIVGVLKSKSNKETSEDDKRKSGISSYQDDNFMFDGCGPFIIT